MRRTELHRNAVVGKCPRQDSNLRTRSWQTPLVTSKRVVIQEITDLYASRTLRSPLR